MALLRECAAAQDALPRPHHSLTVARHAARPDQRSDRQHPSVAAVAAATGLNKTTVLRAIQAGRISGTKNEINEWRVDPAELHRLMPPLQAASVATESATGDAPPADPRAVSGRAEAIRSRDQFNDMAQAKRLSNLANSDQKAQQTARTRWWRLVTGT